MRRILILLVLTLCSLPNAWSQNKALEEAGIALIPMPRECKVTSLALHDLCSIKEDRITAPTLGADEYGITIRNGEVSLWGNLVWARQTLAQLTTAKGQVPDVEIHDWAAYPWRGFMHDTGRNYQPIEMLRQTIDLMSRYKLNLFHWHLTDNPAWRIECHCYPQLNDPQYQRKGRDEGKYYTYEEIRSLIAYAKERSVTVLPEIDMPGHSEFFKTTFGFTMDSDSGRQVLAECIKEFFDEIPVSLCPYLHVGSDEIHIADPAGFATWVQTLVKDAGRIPVAWDPGLPTQPFTLRQIWREGVANNADAKDATGRYIDSFVGYLNYYDPIMYAMRAYQHQAAAQSIPDTDKCVGGILCLWNDVRVDNKVNISRHNGMLAGMMAFSERMWQGGPKVAAANENLYPDPTSAAGLALANMERRMMMHRQRYYSLAEMPWTANASLSWKVTIAGKTLQAWGGAIDLDALCKANDITADEQKEASATTLVRAAADTIVNAWLGFDIPARSDRMSTGIGLQGCWENGGQCFLNGEAVLPSTAWKEPGAYNYPFHTWGQEQAEQPYQDEQFYWMRTPVKLHLHKGDNIIRIVNPHSFKGQRWSFAFMPL